ncbi:MAG: L-lysine 6-transaminase [candidate division KSB1 bacterium]|nr:L-lysine 6-transaminase [candidate division KSB1 bacterium]MDZ7319227.1 L-lysine 6-transaminase [candidate division KSB1 bacterium]MDZ7341082.1 L-lysine 6-transaminase [candidate division KSB1 bacterium]
MTDIKPENDEEIMMKIEPKDVVKSLSKHMLVDGFDIIVDLEKSTGSYLVDARDGKKYLDFFTFFATLPIGFNHPGVLTEDFKARLLRSAINKPSNSDFYTVEMAEFVETFARVALPKSLPHLFFISGGTLAVENALKTAFDWKIRLNFKKGHSQEKGNQVIHFQQAFHGRSGYTLSLTNTADPRKTKYFPKFNWPRILNPKITFPLNDENLNRVKQAEQTALQQIKRAIQENPDDIAAIIIEPIQGEGGDNHFRSEFFKELRTLANENDILLIFDEVQTGLGLTGKMWAYQHFGIEPDIVAFGKKTQVCGIMASKRIDLIEDNVFAESSRINSTWGGNLVDMVRSQRYLEIIEAENLVENAARVGKYFLDRLLKLQSAYASCVSNARGRGLMIAFDLPDEHLRDRFMRNARQNGLLVLKCGERSIRFRPSLNITNEIVDEAMKIVEDTICSCCINAKHPEAEGKGEL